jgi:hypothetical protein
MCPETLIPQRVAQHVYIVGQVALSMLRLHGKPDHVISWMCPHTKMKPPVENALRYIKTFTHTVIGPSLFFANDYKVKAAIARGRLWVEPFGEEGTSRVAVHDIADAVAIAILDQGKNWNDRKIMLGRLNRYTANKNLACLIGCVK